MVADRWMQLPEAWRACLEEAWAAYCAGSNPVGAVVTDREGMILVRARNHTFERTGRPSASQASPLAHAELTALASLDYDRVDPHPCALYASTEPCPLCFGALYMSGVRELRYAARDPYAGSTNLLGTTPYLTRKPIRIVPPESAELETAITALSVDFALRHGLRAGPSVVLEAWRAVLPDGVRLGTALFASGWLEQMRNGGAGAGDVISGLLEQARSE